MPKRKVRPVHFYDMDDPQATLGCVVKCRLPIGAPEHYRWNPDIKKVTCKTCLRRQHTRLAPKRRKRVSQPMNAGMGMSGIQMGN